MKKLFTFITAAVCFTTAANAQRMINLEATMTSITPNVVSVNQSFTMKGVIKNLGPAAVKTTDSILYGFTYNGAGLDFTGSGQQTIYLRTNKAINVNDTIQVNFGMSWTSYTSAADSTKPMCLVTNILNRSADSAKDGTLTNNSGCANLTRKANSGTGIETVTITKANTVSVYPNPAKDEANVTLNMNSNSDVTIKVYDITGRVVVLENKGTMSKGDHSVKLNTEKLQNGIYLYQVIMGEQIESGKLSISK